MKKVLRVGANVIAWIVLIFALLITIIVFSSGRNNGVANLFGYIPMTVESDSMKPTFSKNDLIICKEIDDLNSLQKGDVILLASRGGKTKELIPMLEIAKAKGVNVITVTENLDSPLAKDASVVLKQYVNRETDKYNCQGTTSSTALCMIFHALQTALIEETGYKNEQFALIHPGGAVGERLNH